MNLLHGTRSFREIALDDSAVWFPILHQLRPEPSQTEAEAIVREAHDASGYRLYGVFEEETCVGLVGWRILTDFVHGKHLYIDDLVVDSNQRSRGIGEEILAAAESFARAQGCTGLRLCTGVDNARGKSFYEKCGLSLRAVAFKRSFE